MSIEDWRKWIEHKVTVLNRDSSTYRIAKKYGLVKEFVHPIVFHYEEVENDD